MYEDDLDLKLINKINSLKDFSLRNHFLDLFHKYKFKFIGIMIPISKKLKFYDFAKNIYKFLRSLS